MTQQNPYQLLGKEEGIKALANAFYDAMETLPEAATIRNMHAKSTVDIRQKLFEYLNGWLGGPHLYREKYGTICLTDPHKPYAIGEAERDQWLMCWGAALDKIEASKEVREMMQEPIFRMANFFINQR